MERKSHLSKEKGITSDILADTSHVYSVFSKSLLRFQLVQEHQTQTQFICISVFVGTLFRFLFSIVVRINNAMFICLLLLLFSNVCVLARLSDVLHLLYKFVLIVTCRRLYYADGHMHTHSSNEAKPNIVGYANFIVQLICILFFSFSRQNRSFNY